MVETRVKSVDWRKLSRKMTIHHEMIRFTKSFKENFVNLIISSLGLLVALSWNNFWSTFVNSLAVENTLPYRFYIAISMTVLAVILTYFLSKLKNNQ